MIKNIIIISESEIVKRGISSIIRNNFNINVSCINNIRELKKFKKQTENFFLIMIAKNSYTHKELSEELDISNKIDVIWLCNDFMGNSSVEDKVICLDASQPQIVEIISGVLKGNNISEDKIVDVSTLSDREAEVLKFVAKGFSNKEIAEKLFISMHTVISHRKNITKKLGIKSISGLTVYAILNKLIEP
jgi:DNA-binding CsgD family transcriptional regulator